MRYLNIILALSFLGFVAAPLCAAEESQDSSKSKSGSKVIILKQDKQVVPLVVPGS